MSYLLGIETANPRTALPQEALAAFYANAINEPDAQVAKKISILSRKCGIKQRYSVIDDYSRQPADFTFFAKNSKLEPMPGLNARMALYKDEALQLSLDAINKLEDIVTVKANISHIITVSCTGMFAPGLDIELINALQLRPNTHRSSINFMGCNAAILALKQADQICGNDPEALVLIVCTELCTIHFQKEYSDNYILSNLLFSDGVAAALVSGRKPAVSTKYNPLSIKSFQSMIIHEGHDDMAWQLSEAGFMMNLTTYVSGLINKNIAGVLDNMGIVARDIQHWAIHPGGKKILDDFCATMNMEQEQLANSYSVLHDYGNMSSPTILFVLQRLMESAVVQQNEQVYAAAFGPGLSIESVLMAHV